MRAPFVFEGTVRTAVHQFKYKNLRALAAPLAALMDAYFSRYPLPGEVLVPVPLHPKRLRERGYNQSALLARELGRLRGMSVVADCLVRREARSPQARTSGVAERRTNVAGAFGCRDRRLAEKAVILVDDVATTGATLEDCAAALHEGGAASVWGFTLAREI
jgi:competence protein ComFC